MPNLRRSSLFVGLVAIAVSFGLAALAQGPSSLSDQISRNEGDWRDATRTHLRAAYPDRVATTDRAIALILAVNEKCQTTGKCAPGTMDDLRKISKDTVCAAYPIDAICVRRFNVPRGVQAFDFQGRGNRPFPGFTVVTPGDPRIGGTLVPAKYNDAYPVSGDSLIGVSSFKTQAPAGQYRAVLISGKRPLAQALSSPFGRNIDINGRNIEIIAVGPDRWLPRGALANGTPEQVYTAANILPGSAPAIVIEFDHAGGELNFNFPQTAEISGLLVEPMGRPSAFVLDSTAVTIAVVNNANCLDQQQRIDNLALTQAGNVPRCPAGKICTEIPKCAPGKCPTVVSPN